MEYNFTGKQETPNLYKLFYNYRVSMVDQLPKLFQEGYEPVSIAEIIERRMSAPDDVIKNWREHIIDTIDSIAFGEDDDAAIVLDSEHIRSLNKDNFQGKYGLQLTKSEWEELREQRSDKICYLTKEEYNLIWGKGIGYIRRYGRWGPANAVFGKVWEGSDNFQGLARGKNIREYAKLVRRDDRHYFPKTVLHLPLGPFLESLPCLRTIQIFHFSSGHSDLYNNFFLSGEAELIGKLKGVV